MDVSPVYAASRSQLCELALTLSADQAAASLVATPPWSVLDGYRHLTGVCSDFLTGTLDGAGSPEWTRVQVASRESLSLADVRAEWELKSPQLEAKMANAGPAMAFLAFDVWTHEQDIRAAAGGRGIRGDGRDAALAELALELFGDRYAESGAPALLILVDGEQHVLGGIGADPEVTLGTSPYELLRIIFGRRSAGQIARANWTGDISAAVAALHIFDLPNTDIAD